jgi:hypothetical protein
VVRAGAPGELPAGVGIQRREMALVKVTSEGWPIRRAPGSALRWADGDVEAAHAGQRVGGRSACSAETLVTVRFTV